MFQSASALSHVDEAVVVVWHVAHHFRGGRHDALEVLFELHLLGAVGRLEGELVVVALMREPLYIEVAQQQGRVVEHVEVRSGEGAAVIGIRPHARGDVLPSVGQLESDADGMCLFAGDVHEDAVGCHEGDVPLHAAGGHIPLVGINAVVDLHASVLGQGHAPAVQALLLPGEFFALGVPCTEVGQVLGEVQHLVVPRCPARHRQHHVGGVRLGAVGGVGEADVQVMACCVGADGVIQPIVGGGLMVAGRGDREEEHREEDV